MSFFNSPKIKKMLRITNTRIVSQVFFFSLFLFFCWATWVSRLEGFTVSRLLEFDPLVGLTTALATGTIYRFLGWGLLILLVTLLFGRVFCNWVCPMGTMLQFTGWLFNILKAPDRIKSNRYRPMYFFKYSLLIIFILMAIGGSLQIGLLDPIVIVYRTFAVFISPLVDHQIIDPLVDLTGNTVASDWLSAFKFAPGVEERIFNGAIGVAIMFIFLLSMNFIIPRFFCRVLCPLGALLGVFSRFAIFRINRDVHKCTNCDLCLTRCEGASDPQGQLRLSECFACMNCIDDCPEDALSYRALGLDIKQVKVKPDISRRKVIYAGVLGLLGAPLMRINATNKDNTFDPSLIRPPGSVEEDLFLAKCIKCDQCINACPTNVLQPATFAEGGFSGLWTPVMKFNIGHCQLQCNLCSEVCPTGAIQKITVEEKLGVGPFNEKGPIRLGTAFFDKGRCLPHAMQIPCVVCEEVCPTSPKAIQTEDIEVKDAFGNIVTLNKPYVLPDLCIGCGICETECPVKDQKAVYVTAVGESRSKKRSLLLKNREFSKPQG